MPYDSISSSLFLLQGNNDLPATLTLLLQGDRVGHALKAALFHDVDLIRLQFIVFEQLVDDRNVCCDIIVQIGVPRESVTGFSNQPKTDLVDSYVTIRVAWGPVRSE